MSSFDATPADLELPPVDVRLVEPETRDEIVDGVLVHVPPADEPHGSKHSKISALVEAHAGPDVDVASDMLTRTSRTNDAAPDVSVFPYARDPRTGGRQIEQLAFEVVSTESLSHAGRKAAKLVARGVRRVFAVDVERGHALEWSSSLGTWSVLDANAHIEDPALAAPLPIKALLGAAKADDAIARALLVKRNPVIEAATVDARQQGLAEGKQQGLAEGKQQGLAEGKQQGLAEGKQQGLAEGLSEALLAMLGARGVPLPSADRARILDEQDPDRLRRWIERAATGTDLAEVLGEP